MEKYVFDLIAFLVASGLVGLVALLVNGLKSELREIKAILNEVVSKEVCKIYRDEMKKDINNIAVIARGK